MSRFNLLVLFVYTVLATACATSGTPNTRSVSPRVSPQTGAIMGHFAAPGGVQTLMLQPADKPRRHPYSKGIHAHVDARGYFFFENLEPGEYYLMSLASGPEGRDFYRLAYNKKTALSKIVTVSAGNLTYMGSFIIDNVISDLLKLDSFRFRRVDEPTEKQVLQGVIPMVVNTGWEQLVFRRLRDM